MWRSAAAGWWCGGGDATKHGRPLVRCSLSAAVQRGRRVASQAAPLRAARTPAASATWPHAPTHLGLAHVGVGDRRAAARPRDAVQVQVVADAVGVPGPGAGSQVGERWGRGAQPGRQGGGRGGGRGARRRAAASAAGRRSRRGRASWSGAAPATAGCCWALARGWPLAPQPSTTAGSGCVHVRACPHLLVWRTSSTSPTQQRTRGPGTCATGAAPGAGAGPVSTPRC